MEGLVYMRTRRDLAVSIGIVVKVVGAVLIWRLRGSGEEESVDSFCSWQLNNDIWVTFFLTFG